MDLYGYVSYNTWTVFALVDGVLELCFPRTLVNAMLPNAIYRILDSTRTEYIIWKYIVAKNRNVLFEFTISSLKYVFILFDRDAALMPVPQKSRTNRAGWSRCPSSFWPGECTQQGVTVREVSSHVKRGRVRRTGPTYMTSSKYVDLVALFTRGYMSHVAIFV